MPDPVTLPPSYRSRDVDLEDAFGGIGTFAHLPYTECTNLENSGTFDIGIVGHPFDLGVSYRPGARFGPNGARQGARRISPAAGWECVT
jgi:agmatinase